VGTEPVPAKTAGQGAPGTDQGADFDQLLRDLSHRVWEVRRNACEELGSLADQRAVPPLIRLLNDPVGAVRFAAAEALGRLGDRSAVPALLALLDNPVFGAYGPVIDALASLRAQQAIPAFIRFLRDQDPRVRSLAANALMVMTRQFISFKAKAAVEERNAAIAQWEAWWEKNKNTILKSAAGQK
jgi:HEAT repeat protein